MRRFWLTIPVVAFALAIISPASWAQNTNSGDIRGVATDPTGAAIPEVAVTVLDLDKGVTTGYKTNRDGLFDTGPIVTGHYKITFSKPGFGEYVRSSVTLDVGTITINAEMKVGGVTEEVVVNTDVPLIKTETGEQSTTLVAKEMQNLPNQGQDWQNFVKLIPGATGTASFGATGQALSVNGNLPYNAVLNDGASSALSHSGNADVSVFETVQEVQISTSAFSAQYGIGGVAFNQISKGGSNKFHGSLYEYAQNDFFNARSYFQSTAPYLRFHNFGGSFSGPVTIPKLYSGKDRAFFYFNFDKVINKSASTGFATVPTVAMRAGDFSGLAPIYQPGTATSVTAGGKTYINRTQFANNKLTTLDPAALKVQALIPLPNSTVKASTDPNTGVTTNNYYYNIRGGQPFVKYFGRFDYDINQHNRLTASVTKRDNPAVYTNAFPCPINCYVGDVDSYNAQITDVWNISSRTINEARLGYTNQLNFFVPQSAGTGVGGTLGIPFLQTDILPTINIGGGYTSIQPGTAAVYKEHNYDPSDVVTMIRGRHVLHFGGEYLIFQDNSTAWGNLNAATVGFTGTYTQCTYCQASPSVGGGGLAASGNGYADFLLGTIQNWSAGVTPEFAGRQKAPQMFVQDDWKLRSNLTVNLGLRYQIMEGWSDGKQNQRTFDPNITNSGTGTLGAMWYASTAGNGRTQLQNNVYDTFLPRLGVAWQVQPTTVIRGGYGIFAYLWSLDTYGGGEGGAFGASGSTSDTTSGFTPIGSLSSQNAFPYVSTTTNNAAFNGQGVGYNDQTTPVSKIHQYNMAVEKQIGANMSASIAYVGSRSVNLNFNRDINQVPESKLTTATGGVQANRPYTQYQAITGSTYNASANYNSLQLTMQRRLVRNLSFQSSYVWSKFLDEYDSSAWGSRAGTQTYQRSNDVGANYGPSNFDTRHAFKGNAIYVLPFGRGQMFLNKNAFLDEAVGGWHMAATFVMQTGNPFTVTVPSGLVTNYAGSGSIYPNQTSNPGTVANRSINHWFNTSYVTTAGATVLTNGDTTAAFTIPQPATFGNMRRNSIYGPGLTTFDMSFGKIFNVYKESVKFQLRVDATNVLNHAQFAQPNTSLSNSSAGKITGTTVGGRNLQLGGRLSF